MTPASAAASIESVNRMIGRGTAWLTLAMVAVTFIVVVMRYWFNTGWIWLQESVTWMHAAVFMLAAAYALADDQHVRVDIFYRNMNARQKALVDTAGTCLFLLPVTAFLFWSSWDYVSTSWVIHETSREAGGLPYPWPSLMKSFIPAMALMLFLQGISMVLRNISTLMSATSAGRS